MARVRGLHSCDILELFARSIPFSRRKQRFPEEEPRISLRVMRFEIDPTLKGLHSLRPVAKFRQAYAQCDPVPWVGAVQLHGSSKQLESARQIIAILSRQCVRER